MSKDDSQLSNTIDILCEKYGIQKETIKYVKLNCGRQFIAEMCEYEILPDEDLDVEIPEISIMDLDEDMASMLLDDSYHIFFYPLEIVEEVYGDIDGIPQSTRYFKVFNDKNGDVYEPVDRNDIQLMSFVSDTVLLDYLVSVSLNYFDTDTKSSFIESSIIHNYDLSNVVDFFQYKTQRKNGNR